MTKAPHLITLLQYLAKSKASDMLLTAGAPPSLKISNQVKRLSMAPLTPDDCENYAKDFLPDEEWNKFRNEWTLNGTKIKDWSFETWLRYNMEISLEYWDYIKDTSWTIASDSSLLIHLYRWGYVPSLYTEPAETIGSTNPYTLKNGFSSLCIKLYENVTKYENNDVWLNSLTGKSIFFPCPVLYLPVQESIAA